MKLKLLSFLFISATISFIIFQGASGGVGAIQNLDRTGAPGSSQPCSQCHSGGSFKTTLAFTIRDTSSLKPVTTVNGGQTYAVIWKVNHLGTPAAFGFQGTTRNTSNGNAGTWSTPSPNAQISTVGGKVLVEHKLASPADTFLFLWTAPTNFDTVMFYGSGNAVNGNSATTGDTYGGLISLNTILVNHPVGINEVTQHINVYPTPADKFIAVEGLSANARASLYNLQGEQVLMTKLVGDSKISTAGLPDGVYILHLADSQNQLQRKLVITHQ